MLSHDPGKHSRDLGKLAGDPVRLFHGPGKLAIVGERPTPAYLASKSMRGSTTAYSRSPARFMTSPSREKKNNVPKMTG
uniref:Uncharacterized protein n=1 Tax=Candidatus Kentrum sp. DK TaxID=2126562 RepID=A0A450SL53_9GAMM|nr:MAG: hypothetical protein BECKDK2373B_GA0170837_10466 [Candidatus Kentron sp. DK]VFJ60738.1 MAG: hypothetical protein BECKDK2373C_GA0170839_10843 [Candidatus Kentron sp. DK]